MTDPDRRLIVPTPGFGSTAAGSFLAQMDDLSRRLAADTRALTPAMLEWQPRPGMNTIGMLLAHNAIVEVFWCLLGLEHHARPLPPFHDLLGIGEDDDGMPLKPGGVPPATLAGKSLSFYDDLLERARAHLRRVARGLSDASLDEELTIQRPNGTVLVINRRWTLYHLLEHYAGHYGQVLLLIHQYRDAHPVA